MTITSPQIKFKELYADATAFTDTIWAKVKQAFDGDSEFIDETSQQYKIINPNNIYLMLINQYGDRFIRFDPDAFENYFAQSYINKLPGLYTKISWQATDGLDESLRDIKNWGGMIKTNTQNTSDNKSNEGISTSPLTSTGENIDLTADDNLTEKHASNTNSTMTNNSEVDNTDFLKNLTKASTIFIQNALADFIASFNHFFVSHSSFSVMPTWGWS